jgi:threonine/homoserine/homoserine lactone efflux protein
MPSFFTEYGLEFLTIAAVHLLAVASPGPDFAIVLKHSISYGRRAAMFTSIGIGLGILVHVAYSLLGIGLLIQTTPGLFQALSYVAAAYLFYIGLGALKSKAQDNQDGVNLIANHQQLSDKRSFWLGFLTNGLNPKATLFFLSLFAVVVSSSTSNTIKVLYGVYLAFATGLWFCFLSFCLSSKNIRQFLVAKGYWFDRCMGLVLVLLAIQLVVSA